MARWIALVLSIVGCRGAAPAQPSAEAPTGYLVWSSQGRHQLTRWLDADGVERGRAEQILIAAAGTVWRVDTETVTAKTGGCRMGDDDGRPEPGQATGFELHVTSIDGGTRVVAARPNLREADEFESWDHGITVTASLGPVMFGVQSIDGYACGAHGAVASSAWSFDLDSRSFTTMKTQAAPPHLAPALSQLQGELPAEQLDPGAPWHLGATFPQWTDGRLGAEHLVYTDACYACGNGEWSSYTWAAWIDDVRIPDTWPDASAVPQAVAAAIGATPGGVSWGPSDDTWATAMPPP